MRMADVAGDSSVFLIGTKTKLAPIKATTIPRLELNASLLLARWLSRIRDILSPQLNILNFILSVRAWSDSMVVLSWLKIPHESFKIYVSNRVHQIHTLLPDCKWSYVESSDNPADCASRGLMPATLSQFDLYWHGPRLTCSDPSVWDESPIYSPCVTFPNINLCRAAHASTKRQLNGSSVFLNMTEWYESSHMCIVLPTHAAADVPTLVRLPFCLNRN